MNRVVAIGATHEMEGFALAGVQVIPAATKAAVTAAWTGLDHDVGLVILSPATAEQLGPDIASRSDLLTVVMP
jgi:vacuolar-type H+-ATPase subunit F/Vma7